MSYWFGTKLENFLFYGYDIVSTWGLISTCLGLAALAILYEAMKLLQMKLHEISKDQNQVTQPVQNTDSSSLISRASGRSAVIHTSFRWYIIELTFLILLPSAHLFVRINSQSIIFSVINGYIGLQKFFIGLST